MGLDMCAYVGEPGQHDRYWGQYGRSVPPDQQVSSPREIGRWRKHPNLHGWMEQLYLSRGGNAEFNGVEIELFWQDLDQLQQAVEEKTLPSTSGFFFGRNADDYYREHDLKFIRDARAELFCGLRVFYNSSW